MSIRTPKVPSTYRAIDSSLLGEDGPPLDAFTADTIAQAHNRLVASASPMGCVALPMEDADIGDETWSRYHVSIGRSWGQLLPSLVVSKKPGADAADFRAVLRVPLDTFVDLQVTTLAAESPSRPGHVTVKGTGDWEVYEVNDVQVHPGPQERCRLWARASGGWATAPTTYGSPVTGEIQGLDEDRFLCSGASGAAVTWNVSPNTTFASAGYFLVVQDPDGVDRGVFEIVGVTRFLEPTGPTTWGMIYCPPGSTQYLNRTINLDDELWSFVVVEGRHVEVASFAGATRQRTR